MSLYPKLSAPWIAAAEQHATAVKLEAALEKLFPSMKGHIDIWPIRQGYTVSYNYLLEKATAVEDFLETLPKFSPCTITAGRYGCGQGRVYNARVVCHKHARAIVALLEEDDEDKQY